MSKEVTLGKYEDGNAFKVNVDRLIETRLIVQASSGGGKTYAIRKLVEEMYGKVQIIILDIEGDFSSLRERFDFVVAGKGGDIAADPRYAEQLARKILELKTDLICDLYELKQYDRIRFVKLFLEAMVNAPKDLWHPTAVILDEAHIFAPEGARSESATAVADMASRGRKRGFFLIPATQRPAKISKDVVAECQNKLIGLGNTDLDRERGAKELGFSDRAKVLTLRDLEPGEFYAVGPAFNRRGANLVRIGEAQTKHTKSGSGKAVVHAPAPTAKVKAQLAKLVDLPREAEEELKDIAALRIRVRELEREAKKTVVTKTDEKDLERAYARGLQEARKESAEKIKRDGALIGKAYELANCLNHILESSPDSKKAPESFPNTQTAAQVSLPQRMVASESMAKDDGREFGQCERKILGFLALKPGEYFTKVQIGAMTGYRHSSGGFNNAISKLNAAGLIVRHTGSIALNPSADISGLVDNQPHRLEDWISKLGQCERKIYEMVLHSPGETFSKQEIGETTQYSPGSGGFNNAISRLSTLGLISRHHDGRIGLNPEVQSVGT